MGWLFLILIAWALLGDGGCNALATTEAATRQRQNNVNSDSESGGEGRALLGGGDAVAIMKAERLKRR